MMINITREQAAILIDLLINAEIRASDAIGEAQLNDVSERCSLRRALAGAAVDDRDSARGQIAVAGAGVVRGEVELVTFVFGHDHVLHKAS